MSTPNEHAYWISWYHPSEAQGLFELHSPWWISGYAFDPDRHIICAAVRAESEDAAWGLIRSSFDVPVTIEERFIEDANEPNWSPFCDRWPQANWMEWNGTTTCACGECQLIDAASLDTDRSEP